MIKKFFNQIDFNVDDTAINFYFLFPWFDKKLVFTLDRNTVTVKKYACSILPQIERFLLILELF